jgi:transcription antitermination factor NusG
MGESPLPWYAIWTRARHEKVVRDQLKPVAADVFLPTIARWSRWHDRKKRIDWPLFPGYCFAQFDPQGAIGILRCNGVVAILSTNGEPVPIPSPEIIGIRRVVETQLVYDPCPLIKESAVVEVCHGPLTGVIGRLTRKGPHARLVLAVELIGQAISVEVDAADVRPY